MSDFMKWLYKNYIKPQLDKKPQGDYRGDFYLLADEIDPGTAASFWKTQEFTAVHAFMLGVKTGKGLAQSIPDL